MAEGHARRDPVPGAWLRRLPLVPLIAFASLSLGMVSVYESALYWSQACSAPGIGMPCAGVSPWWLVLAGIWAACAVAIGGLMGAQALLARRGRSLGIPDPLVLASGVGVSLLGLVWLGYGPGTGAALPTSATEIELHVAYVTSALLLFALTFLDYDPDRIPGRKGAALLAVVNAGFATTSALAWWP